MEELNTPSFYKYIKPLDIVNYECERASILKQLDKLDEKYNLMAAKIIDDQQRDEFMKKFRENPILDRETIFKAWAFGLVSNDLAEPIIGSKYTEFWQDTFKAEFKKKLRQY